MPEINKMISDANGIRKGILKQLQEYLVVYASLEKEVQNRFHTEYTSNDHKLAGLEDFHQLSYACKKNLTMVKTAFNLVSKISDLSGFDIDEEAETLKELDKILKDR